MSAAPVLDNERRAILSAPSSPTSSTMPDALDGASAEHPNKSALHYFGRDFTFADVRRTSDALASALSGQGVGKGDRVIVQLQNIPQFVFVAFAAWRLGAIIVPISPMYRAPEVNKIAADSEPLVLVTANEIWAAQGSESIAGTSIKTVITTGMADYAADVPAVLARPADSVRDTAVLDLMELVEAHDGAVAPGMTIDPDDTAIFTYTSGTTGPPKGALTSHANLVWAGAAYPAFNGIAGPDQVLICTAPLVHITGLALHLSAWVNHGSKFVLAYRFEPNEIGRAQV